MDFTACRSRPLTVSSAAARSLAWRRSSNHGSSARTAASISASLIAFITFRSGEISMSDCPSSLAQLGWRTFEW